MDNESRQGDIERRRVIKTLRPGQPGTLKLTQRHGAALICVRYREDIQGTMRCTTVELIVDEAPIQRRPDEESIVGVRIEWREAKLRERAKALGAKWDADTKLWQMTMRIARLLKVTHRVPKDTSCQ